MFFEVKVKYTKQMEDGTFKRVSEPYLIDSVTFGDAEQRIYKELEHVVHGEMQVTAIKVFPVHDLFQYDDSETWYKNKIECSPQTDELTSKRKVKITILNTAGSVKESTERAAADASKFLSEFKVVETKETKIVEIFPYEEQE